MVIFLNNPLPVPNPHERAMRMVIEMRERVGGLVAIWRKRGLARDFGVGIADGYATIEAIGFEGRWDYGAIGTVTNLAARLWGEAGRGGPSRERRLDLAGRWARDRGRHVSSFGGAACGDRDR